MDNGTAKQPPVNTLPTLKELVEDTDLSLKQNALMVLLNQSPPDSWLKSHPMATTKDTKGNTVPAKYLPIERVEWLLSRIYTKWWVEVRNVAVIANSVAVTVRLYVINPLTNKEEWNDGIGASPIQTDKGAAATDWAKVKSAGVQMAAPAAESYALKDAAEKFGNLFGKDANRQAKMDYTSLLKVEEPTVEELRELLEQKRDKLSVPDLNDANRIINKNETNNFKKLKQKLQAA